MSRHEFTPAEHSWLHNYACRQTQRFATVHGGEWIEFDSHIVKLSDEIDDFALSRNVVKRVRQGAIAEIRRHAIAEKARLRAAMPAMRGNA